MASFEVILGSPDRIKPLPPDRASWKIGLVVQLHSLSKNELNGKVAELIGKGTVDGDGNLRYQAMVVDTEFKGNFKADNMREVPAPSSEDVEECVQIFAEVIEITQQFSGVSPVGGIKAVTNEFLTPCILISFLNSSHFR